MSARRRSSVLHQIGHDLPSDLKKLSFNSLKHKSSVSSQSSEIQDEILAQINASQSTLNDEDSVEQNLQELNFYYGIVKRHLLRYQAVSTGLFPSVSSEKNVGSVRDTLYCCMATWSLHQAYKKINDDKGKCYELGQCTVLGLQGILSCWMRQAKKLESFKANQNPDDALHVIFDMKTFGEVQNSHKYPHLQLDVVSLYLLFLVQAIASGLQIIGTQHEVAFVQNLVFYVERAYRTPDFGMWQRGSVYNNGEPEVNASSIGMAKAALESINGFNLFGENGANWSVIYVDIDAHNRNRSIFETILPRESGSKVCGELLNGKISMCLLNFGAKSFKIINKRFCYSFTRILFYMVSGMRRCTVVLHFVSRFCYARRRTLQKDQSQYYKWLARQLGFQAVFPRWFWLRVRTQKHEIHRRNDTKIRRYRI